MASTNSSLSPQLLLWLSILFITSCRKASSSPESPPLLLSLNCTPPRHPTPQNNKPIEILLSNLIAEVTRTRFATSTVNLIQDRFDGLMQCRLNTSSNDCIFCVRTAQRTISTLCSESEAVAAWFDGCYLQYYKFSRTIYVPKSTSSNKTSVTRQALQFEKALGVLLLQLRVRIGLTSSRGFVSEEVRYGDNDSRIYGLAECVRSVSSKDCEVCVLEATEMLYQCCNGRVGGVAAAGNCIVRFETHRFFSYGSGDAGGSDSGGWSGAGGASEAVNIYDENEHHEGSWGLQTKVAWAWGVGVACLLGFVLGAWLLRRKVLNTAKVATISGSSEVEHKDLA